MRRVVSLFGLLVAIGGLAALGADIALHKTVHELTLKWGLGFSAFGLLIAAFMADPANVLAVADRVVWWKRGAPRESEGDSASGTGGRE
jgi:hypothetical protein